ncbi:MAG: hypothetical protein IJ125_02935 [Atopobiaceae bacterium]|nr:hypothetical protein [Atopobiaceae bacterium]
MPVIISHQSALEYLRAVPPPFFGAQRLQTNYDLAHESTTRSDLRHFRPADVGLSLPQTHVLMHAYSQRGRDPQYSYHVCQATDLAPGSILRIGDNVYSCGPEFAFYQLSQKLSQLQAVVLACELCAKYSHFAKPVSGFYQRPPLTSVAQMQQFLDKHPSLMFQKKARAALSYALDNSESPMETVMALFLSLPRVIGGFNCLPPNLNYEVPLDEAGRRMIQKTHCRVDLAWPELKIGLEYDGKEYHGDAVGDRRRREALLHLGWQIFTVSFDDISSIYRLERSVLQPLADKLPRRNPPTRSRGGLDEAVSDKEERLRREHLLNTLLAETRFGWGLTAAFFPFTNSNQKIRLCLK